MRSTRRRWRFHSGVPALLAAALLACAAPAAAQDAVPAPAAPIPEAPRRTFAVAKAADHPRVDGVLDDAAWQGPPSFTLDYETRPGDNVPPRVKTEMWITYDERTLFVAVRAHDPEPAKIRARLTDRDRAFQDDFVGVVLDTFNDERRAFEFFVNPLGVQMDLSQNDVTGNEDESWDAIWDSAGRITDQGFEVELAIPFSSLRFPRASGPQTWGIDALRVWPRDQRYRIGLNALPRGKNCYLCNESKLVGFDGVTPGRNVEFDPTLTANRTETRDDLDGPFASKSKVDPGITARWGITPGMTLNATINPDFSQVEADASQLSVNTQFALFYPEKRPFFLEGADLFDTKINAVYTREIADPSFGLKLTGKQGSSAFGVIVARDQRTNFVLPGPQGDDRASLDAPNTSSILRYRRDLAGSGSALGGLFTSREGTDYHNRVVGMDGLFRWANTEAVRIEVLASDTVYPLALRTDSGQPSGTLRGTAVRAVYQHATREGMAYISYQGADEDFRADLGYIPQVGYRKGYGILERYLYADHGEHWWNRFTYGVESTWTYEQHGGPLQKQVAPYLSINGPRQSYLNLYLGLGPSYYRGQRFDRTFLQMYGEAQLSAQVYVSLDSRIGQEIDYANARQGDLVRATPYVRFDLGRHWRLGLQHFYETLDVRGGRLYTAHLSDVRATYQINVRSFVRLVTQHLDLRSDPTLYSAAVDARAKSLGNQLLFSYKLNPQTVLFLGYSDNFVNNPQLDLKQTGRTVFFKIGYAFVL